MEIINRELVQSYLMTTAKYDFSVYEKRVLYRIVETLQHHLEGKKLAPDIDLDLNIFNDTKIGMPIAKFLNGEEDQNYTRTIKALRNLRKKDVDIHYENGDLTIVGLISRPKIVKRSGYVEFTLHAEVIEALLDFAGGHRIIEMKTAFKLESVYSMRFYEIFSKQKGSIRHSIDKLKAMFGISDKYKDRPADFIKKVVKVAKDELDKKSPYSFTYKPEKEGKKIKNILFTAVYIPENEDKELQKKQLKKKASVRWELSNQVIDALRYKFDFTDKEIKHNLPTLSKAEKGLEDLVVFISEKHSYSRKIEELNNPKGWLINAIKKELQKQESNE